MYWDANTLYGHSMMQPLPYKDLEWDNEVDIDTVLRTSDDGSTGYVVEVDLEFPVELHDKFKEFPPCCENTTPKLNWLSDYQLELARKDGVVNEDKYLGANKLIPHLCKHEKYVIHCKNLKYVHNLGVKITKLHRAISFTQSTWLKPYIQFNNEKRREATDDFSKKKST